MRFKLVRPSGQPVITLKESYTSSSARASTAVAALYDLLRQFLAGRLSRNGMFAVGHGLVLTLCAFLTYRLVIAHVGMERFGVWSLLMAAAAMARLCDVSGGGALARFVATASRGVDRLRARDYVHTVFITSLGFNCVLGFALWSSTAFLLPLFITEQYVGDAQALVPWTITVTVLSALAYAAISSIDGAQRTDHRAMVGSAAALVFLVASWFLVPRFGLIGFAAAQVLQQAAMLTLGWMVLRRHITGLGWLPLCWRREVFVETTGYALRLNAIGVMGVLFEPLAKFAFNHAGGPGLVALFELASRLVTQFRMLALTGAAPLLPAFAARSGSADPVFRSILEKATRVSAIAAIGIALTALVAAPAVSLAVLGQISPELLKMNAALTAGWAINALTLPLYFAAQGVGQLRWNFVGSTLTISFVFVGAFLVAPALGPAGLVAAIVAGLTTGALVVLFGNAHAFDVGDVMWRLRWLLLGATAVIALLCSSAWLVAGLSRV